MLKRCKPCQGSGKVMGGGMMLQDCDICAGAGKIQESSYDEAIAHISKETKLSAQASKLALEKEIKRQKKLTHDSEKNLQV